MLGINSRISGTLLHSHGRKSLQHCSAEEAVSESLPSEHSSRESNILLWVAVLPAAVIAGWLFAESSILCNTQRELCNCVQLVFVKKSATLCVLQFE